MTFAYSLFEGCKTSHAFLHLHVKKLQLRFIYKKKDYSHAVVLSYTIKGRADKQPLFLEAVSVVENKCLVWTQLYGGNAKNEVTPGSKATEAH